MEQVAGRWRAPAPLPKNAKGWAPAGRLRPGVAGRRPRFRPAAGARRRAAVPAPLLARRNPGRAAMRARARHVHAVDTARCAAGSTCCSIGARAAPAGLAKAGLRRSPCAARWRSSPAAPAPARPIPWRACWRCCSHRARRRAAAHRAGGADRQGGRAPEAVDRQGAGRAGRQGRRALPLRELTAAWAPRAPCTACWARARTPRLCPPRRQSARRRRADRRRSVDGAPGDDGRAAGRAAAGATLILLGDKDQLASVEAGAVLGDLCHDAQAGGYSGPPLDYALAASGENIPPAFRGGPARWPSKP
jgi:hypothetical protein